MKKKIAAILTAAMIGTTVFASVVSAASGTIDVISREDGSGTRGAFIELFGIEEKNGDEKVDNTTDEAQITNSTSVMLTTVAGDDYAIGYVSLGALDDSVKAVKIDGAEATADNVKEITKYQDRLTLQQKKEAKANLQKTLSHLSSVKKVRQLQLRTDIFLMTMQSHFQDLTLQEKLQLVDLLLYHL